MAKRRMRGMKDFYPYYLSEHRNPTSRFLHVAGTFWSLLLLMIAFLEQSWVIAAAAVVAGYGCAWIGHFFFEKNRPATFRHPLLSLASDFRFCFEVVTGRRKIR